MTVCTRQKLRRLENLKLLKRIFKRFWSISANSNLYSYFVVQLYLAWLNWEFSLRKILNLKIEKHIRATGMRWKSFTESLGCWCWWRMLETVWLGDKFQILTTSLKCSLAILNIFSNITEKVTNIMILPQTFSICQLNFAANMTVTVTVSSQFSLHGIENWKFLNISE